MGFCEQRWRVGTREVRLPPARSLPGWLAKVLTIIKGPVGPIAQAVAHSPSDALAEKVAGSYDAFVALMNKQAKRMSLTKTYFTSVDGLHLPDKNGTFGYSTAYEVVRI